MIRQNGRYVPFGEIVPKVDGETKDDTLARIYN
jgi:hypothetical protein